MEKNFAMSDLQYNVDIVMSSFNVTHAFEMDCKEDYQKETLTPLIVSIIIYSIFMLLMCIMIVRYYIRKAGLCKNTWCSSLPV